MASPWPIEHARLDELDLDLRNVRIPSADLDQSAIISYMVAAEDVLDLARDILRDGYLDNEPPVVVDENEHRVVLEGNRRITALKVISDPALLGASEQRMERLLSRYRDADTPAEIRVMVAPSREAAQPLLARLHTGVPKKPWLREQQAIFYRAQLTAGASVDDLRTRYPRESSKIVGFIRMGEMREVIRGLRYKDRALEDFVKTSKLKMTNFEYVYERPGIQDALGLAFTKDGLLVSRRIGKNQARGLIYLLERLRAGTLNTRSPELKATSPEHATLVEELRQVVAGGGPVPAPNNDPGSSATGQSSGTAPRSGSGASAGDSSNGTGAGTGTGSTNGAAPAGQNGAGGAVGTRGPNRGDTRPRLNMGGFEYKGSSDGLRRRFEELQRLDVHSFPNAAFDLLRTVLECSIKDYFAAKGQRLTGKTLGPCIKALADAYLTDRRMTGLINAVNRGGAMSASQYSGTSLALNSANHEPDSFATGHQVHEAWEGIKPILIAIVGTGVPTHI